MPSQITSALESLKKSAEGLSAAQRVFAGLLAALLVLGVFALVQWTSKPSMVPLYTNLSPADAAAVVEQLESTGVPYELSNGGGTILVAQSQLYDTRLSVAGAGLPTGTESGYALLDDMSITSSEFQQQVTYQRALEGELAATISAMDGVEVASVKLALPQETVFVSEAETPTASVFIEATPGVPLGTQNVQAIIHLVSASIEGMTSADVAVIDANGVVLSTVGGESAPLEHSGQTAEYEQRVASGVQAMLDQVVGPGNAVVSVTAELNFDRTQTTSETFTSDPEVDPLSESTTLEEYTGVGQMEAGVLGPDNIAVPGVTGEGGEYRKEDTVTNNAVNKVTQTTEAAPGVVRRQSVSVVANEAAAAAINLDDLQAMVAAAAGIQEERGDVVSMSRMAFDTSTADAAQAALEDANNQAQQAASQSMYIEIAKWAAIALGVLALIVTFMVVARRRRKSERMELSLEAVEELEARAQAALEARTQVLLEQANAAADADSGFALEAAPVPDMEAMAAYVREEIAEFATQQPAEVAEVLRGWIGAGRAS
ncbi:flagellar basal-body MS-ring/collar protein FliF [Demequina aestuarii]|uniref:flagellar basal-body MS-ring/collar protein FliF n=1 Tax=Demequina aestuarii TaxID=327095 RepID=UPI0007801DB4|nr:flagellar basal-body MS-ring/collar protein FliF [Demequina aestuarii]